MHIIQKGKRGLSFKLVFTETLFKTEFNRTQMSDTYTMEDVDEIEQLPWI